MSEIAMNIYPVRVKWGPTLTGAFLAVGVAIVLGLFGAAFGFGAVSSGSAGLTVLAAVWQVLTPLVAIFLGAIVTAFLVGKPGAYLNAIMVWCITSAYGALLALGLARVMTNSPFLVELSSATGAALAGLAAILGFLGSIGGAAVGALLERRRLSNIDAKAKGEALSAGSTYPAQRPAAGAMHDAPKGDQPEFRH
jgi:hypothetical protein